MGVDSSYVGVVRHDPSDIESPHNYSPQLHLGNFEIILDFSNYPKDLGYMTKEKANQIANLIASDLGIEARLAN